MTAKATIIEVPPEDLAPGHDWIFIERIDDGPVLAFNPDAVTLPEVMELCKTLDVDFAAAVRLP